MSGETPTSSSPGQRFYELPARFWVSWFTRPPRTVAAARWGVWVDRANGWRSPYIRFTSPRGELGVMAGRSHRKYES